MTRRAFTLVEMAIFLAIGLAIFVVLAGMYQGGGRLFELTSRQISVTIDARDFFENLVTDVRAAYRLERPQHATDFPTDRTVIVYRFRSAQAQDRPAKNVREGSETYPYHTDRDQTDQFLDVQRVTYKAEGVAGEGSGMRIVRTETGGYIKRTVDDSGAAPVYEFRPDASVKPRDPGPSRLATHVDRLEVVPVAVMRDATGRRHRLVIVGHGGSTPEDVAMLVVRYSATRRLPGQVSPEGTIDFATKVWIDHKAYELRYPEFFSSVDGNLSF